MVDLRYFLSAFRRHRGLLWLGVLLSIVTLLASVSLLMLSGWFITATALAGLTLATAQQFNFFTPGAGVRGFSILRTAARYGERLVSHDATFRVLAQLRLDYFAQLIPLPTEALSRFRKGELLNRIVTDIDALDQLYLRLFSPLLSALVVMVSTSVFLWFFSPQVAMVNLAIMALWMVLMPPLFFALGKTPGRAMGEHRSALRQQTLDYVSTLAEQQIYRSENSVRSGLHRSESALVRQQQAMANLQGVGAALVVVGSSLAAVGVLYLSAQQFHAGLLDGPQMAMMMFAVLASFEALMPLPLAFQFLNYTVLAAGRLRQQAQEPPVSFAQTSIAMQDSSLSFSEVVAGYDEVPVINGLNLHVKAGEKVALLGRTGCGKSTLLKLITRALAPKAGEVVLGGVPVEALSREALYQSFTLVTQQTDVFSATLRENLQLAAPNADDATLIAVIERTGLNQMAALKQTDLQQGLDLWLGHGGIKLSGGEQRRLAMARALLKPAPILLLDEPTEGLDPHSEQQLLDLLLDEYRDATVLMITHKTTALERMDRVVRMDAGLVSG